MFLYAVETSRSFLRSRLGDCVCWGRSVPDGPSEQRGLRGQFRLAVVAVFFHAAGDDVQRAIRQRTLKRLCLLPRRRHPGLAPFWRRQDLRHCLQVDGADLAFRICRQKCEEIDRLSPQSSPCARTSTAAPKCPRRRPSAFFAEAEREHPHFEEWQDRKDPADDESDAGGQPDPARVRVPQPAHPGGHLERQLGFEPHEREAQRPRVNGHGGLL